MKIIGIFLLLSIWFTPIFFLLAVLGLVLYFGSKDKKYLQFFKTNFVIFLLGLFLFILTAVLILLIDPPDFGIGG